MCVQYSAVLCLSLASDTMNDEGDKHVPPIVHTFVTVPGPVCSFRLKKNFPASACASGGALSESPACAHGRYMNRYQNILDQHE